MSESALKTSKTSTTHRTDICEIYDRVQNLALNINKNVSRILGALQIGDVSRQRAQHVQSGLALLDRLESSPGRPEVRAAGEILLAAQLEAALLDHSHEVSKLIPSIEGLAQDALGLVALSNVETELSDGDEDFRELKRRMAAAVQLIAQVQGANGAASYLAGRLAKADGAIVSIGASMAEAGRHPLDRKAAELLNRIAYLEAAAQDCVVILERLKDASDALIADRSKAVEHADLALEWGQGVATAATIQAIRDKVQTDIAVHAGKNTDILGLLDRTADVDVARPDLSLYDEDLKPELSRLFSRIEALYAMRQEREVHRRISAAYGLDVAEDPDTTEDGLF